MTSNLDITIVGWYGTETIGDRAILAGIIRIFCEVSSNIAIHLGSLYPVLTDRTLHDDGCFFEHCARQSQLHIELFDSQSQHQLEHAIRHSEALVVGGGPLMDIAQMYMVEYAISYARRKKIKTIVLGCGYGPLVQTETIESANRIINFADLSITRDNNAPFATLSNQIDPAAFACMEFLNIHSEQKTNDYYAVNLREITPTDSHYHISSNTEERLTCFLKDILNTSDKHVRLVPMHTFSIGGDDRIILNRIAQKINSSRIEVITFPPSLEGTMEIYYNACLCIGMRFHSVLMQTLLNGNNLILDYTHPQKGKIIGFMRQMDLIELCQDRYFSLCQASANIQLLLDDLKPLPINRRIIEQSFSSYVNLITDTLNQ